MGVASSFIQQEIRNGCGFFIYSAGQGLSINVLTSDDAYLRLAHLRLWQFQQPWSSNLIGWKLEMGVASSFIQQDQG